LTIRWTWVSTAIAAVPCAATIDDAGSLRAHTRQIEKLRHFPGHTAVVSLDECAGEPAKRALLHAEEAGRPQHRPEPGLRLTEDVLRGVDDAKEAFEHGNERGVTRARGEQRAHRDAERVLLTEGDQASHRRVARPTAPSNTAHALCEGRDVHRASV
jgi:hypothetical protein